MQLFRSPDFNFYDFVLWFNPKRFGKTVLLGKPFVLQHYDHNPYPTAKPLKASTSFSSTSSSTRRVSSSSFFPSFATSSFLSTAWRGIPAVPGGRMYVPRLGSCALFVFPTRPVAAEPNTRNRLKVPATTILRRSLPQMRQPPNILRTFSLSLLSFVFSMNHNSLSPFLSFADTFRRHNGRSLPSFTKFQRISVLKQTLHFIFYKIHFVFILSCHNSNMFNNKFSLGLFGW